MPDVLLSAVLIEDSPVIRERLVPMLETLSAVKVVASVETAEEAIAWLRSNVCDLALVDISLRQGTGIHVLEFLRSHADTVRYAVVFTSHSTGPIRERCRALGAAAFFDKGNELDQLFSYLAGLPR